MINKRDRQNEHQACDKIGYNSYWISSTKDRKSTRLNSSHVAISYAVFCLKKKKKTKASSLRLYSAFVQLAVTQNAEESHYTKAQDETNAVSSAVLAATTTYVVDKAHDPHG